MQRRTLQAMSMLRGAGSLLAGSASLVGEQLLGRNPIRINRREACHPLQIIEIHVRANVPVANVSYTI